MFSLVQKIAFFDDFVSHNTQQIEIKARSLSFQKDEIKSELFILISEKLCQFDPALGSAEAFFFSRLHARLSRFNRDACCTAISLNCDPERDVSLLAEVENKADQTAHAAACFTHTHDKGIVPGAADLSSLAEAASGKSAHQIAKELKITRRRVNQILQKRRNLAAVQSGFDF
jgi:hypothetical protein